MWHVFGDESLGQDEHNKPSGGLSPKHALAQEIIERGVSAARNVLALDLLEKVREPEGKYPYRNWENLYREQLSYDSYGRTTHSVNCAGSCTWKVYVKNNIAFKEEQYADYPDINQALPTYNPRGCQKGANYKEYVYGPQRLKYPLIRTGARGEGKWRKASWEEALSYIAGKIVDVISNHGPDTVTFYSANPAKFMVTYAAGARLANLIGGVMCSFYDWVSDLPPGEPMTWGVQTDSCEAADWFNSKYILLWGSNLLETRIPDAHFMTEARIHGTRIVAIFPEYNPVSIHADFYIPIKPGMDCALALGMANVIVNERLYDAGYIKQFTDMPLLVRKDNHRFLRESDVISGRREDIFYFWDQDANNPVTAPGAAGTVGSTEWTLDLGSINPVLEGNFTVNTFSGDVEVTTVFSMVKKNLENYIPSEVSNITGVNAGLITDIAREYATIKPARIINGAGTNHYYHNDLTNRAQILLAALTGNVGVPGGGFDHYVGQEKIWCEEGFKKIAYPLGTSKQRFQNTTLWTYIHSNIQDKDNLYQRPVIEYIRQSVKSGWMPLFPEGTLENGKSLKVLFIWGANYLNQTKGAEYIIADLLPKLDLIVDIDFRMNTSGIYADVILPAASMFEKWDLSATDLHSYIGMFTPVIPPQQDSKTDWEIWKALAAALSKTNFSFKDTLPDGSTILRDFSSLVKDYTDNGALDSDLNAGQFILDNSVETKGMTMDGINKQSQRFVATGEEWTSDLKNDRAYYGFQRMYELKRPLSTLTGRQQFYIDHPWFLELGEELPMYKPPLNMNKYPLRWLTPHGRWSIHSVWRDAKYQLRLQRGHPIVYLNPAEASSRGLIDNDPVEILNDNGVIIAHLCISHRIPEGMALMYHGWERYSFKRGGFQSPTTIRIKPTQLAGGYGQLKFRVNYWGPTGNQKDTRVEIRKYTGG